MGSGIIISEAVPVILNRYTWMKPMPDGSVEWYEPVDNDWLKVRTDPATATADHTHTGLDQLPDIITLLNSGITGQKTLGGYKFTFNHGVLTGFEPA